MMRKKQVCIAHPVGDDPQQPKPLRLRTSAVLYPRIAHFWQDSLSRKQDLQAKGLIHTSPGQRPGFIVQSLFGCRPTACFVMEDESRLQRSWGFALMNPGRCPGLV